MPSEFPLLFIAGFFGGMLNSIAGGGTFITFPALLLAGVPPISANATNTFASCSGYISGAYAFRKELHAHISELPKYVLVSLLGGIVGAWLLLQTPESLFREAIPWLLLFATLLFVFGSRLNGIFRQLASLHRHASSIGSLLLLLMLVGVCIYGGFFNAGLGIIILSYLALAGHTNINAMNELKLLTSTCVSLAAIALFVYNGEIAWFEGSVVLLGTLTGGYIAARISRQISQVYVRIFLWLLPVPALRCTSFTIHMLYREWPPLNDRFWLPVQPIDALADPSPQVDPEESDSGGTDRPSLAESVPLSDVPGTGLTQPQGCPAPSEAPTGVSVRLWPSRLKP